MIHAVGYSNSGFESVQLKVTAGTAGNIESVKAVSGPTELFGQAEDIEAKRKFKSFVRDGSPVRASFSDYVSIVPPEQWATTNTPFPDIKDWSTLKMRLQRTRCFGGCPDYSVEINGQGKVDFSGTFGVLVMGRHRGTLSKQATEALLSAFRAANYFSLKNSYSYPVTDNPTYDTSIEFDGERKSVRDYVGLKAGMPEAVRDLEEAFDRIAGTEKWIKGNQETASALIAENWDFKADSDENRVLFASAVNSGINDLIQLFVSKGAPALSMTKDGQGALISAASNGDLDLVKRMLANQSSPPTAILTCALGAAARSGNLDLMRLLLDKGGQPNGPGCGQFESVTVLMNAVASHKAEIVKEILEYHPDIDATSGNGGYTALGYFLERAPNQFDTAEIVKLLISAGANVNARDRDERTPVFYACQNQHPEAIRLLAGAGADLNAKDRNGQTALMSCFGNVGVKAVMEAGADLTVKNQWGRTAAEEARKMGAVDKADLLDTAMRQKKAP
jgi:ankyrin repeat protein